MTADDDNRILQTSNEIATVTFLAHPVCVHHLKFLVICKEMLSRYEKNTNKMQF